nr:hypothetical protein [Candidatus Anoxychlamydiales bacterium]
HTVIAGKELFDGNQIEAKNHAKSAAKFGLRFAIDGAIFTAGAPAVYVEIAFNLLAPQALRNKTKEAFQFIDGKIGRLESRGIGMQTEDVVMKVSAAFLRRTKGLLTLGADGNLREPGSEAEALAGGRSMRSTRRKVS